MKKIIIRVCAVVIALVIVALLAVFFSLNGIVKRGVEKIGPQLTKVEVRLGSADISPFSGSGKLSKLFVGNPEGFTTPFAVQMDSIKVGVQIGSVMSDTIVINEVNIQSPEITFDGGLSGNNLNKILDNLNAAGGSSSGPQSNVVQTPSGPKKEKKFIVKDFVLQNAKLHLNVSALGRSLSATVPISDIHLQNLGVAEGGLTPAQLSKQLSQPIYDDAYKAAEGLIASGLKNVPGLGKGAGSLTNVTKSIGGFFNKK
jgi:hypothetical protein